MQSGQINLEGSFFSRFRPEHLKSNQQLQLSQHIHEESVSPYRTPHLQQTSIISFVAPSLFICFFSLHFFFSSSFLFISSSFHFLSSFFFLLFPSFSLLIALPFFPFLLSLSSLFFRLFFLFSFFISFNFSSSSMSVTQTASLFNVLLRLCFEGWMMAVHVFRS